MLSLCGDLVLLLLVVISMTCCTLAVPLSDFYPIEGGASISLDDGFSYPQRPISTSRKIPFFGTLYDFIVVNANGLLSFGTYYNRIWEPHLFPLRRDPSVLSQPILAPFFADINVGRGGQIKYKNYLRIPDNLPILHRATTDVKRYFPYARGFDCQMLLVATWTNVLPFCDTRCYSSANTFQVVFATNYTWSFAFFNYADSGIRWGSFIRSGTTYHAVAGYDGADYIHYHNITGSLTSSISRIDDQSNAGVKGKFAFHVDNNVDNAPQPCEADINCKNGGTCQPDTRLCKCPPGWEGPFCEIDVNECSSGKHPCEQICVNEPGNYSCSCRNGFVLHENTVNCVDNCTINNGGCEHFCNKGGRCHCLPGFQLSTDGKSCEDVNECALRNGGCSQICHNLPGGSACLCDAGFYLKNDSRTCVNGDPCAEDNGGCDQVCAPGGTCLCTDGYTLDSDGKRCNDIDECSGSHGCEQECLNSPGSFICTCRHGHSLDEDGRTCNLEDVCVVNNGGCQHFCISNKCSCLRGYLLTGDGKTCEDVDECAVRSGGCPGHQICDNFPGGSRCICEPGTFLSNDSSTCTSSDPCTYDNGGCDQLCVAGGTCQCYPGYHIDDDDRTCIDDDECENPSHGCSHQCTNTPGSFVCSCNDGYELDEDGKSCTLADQCLVNNGGCDHFCSKGRCDCLTGFTLDSNGKTCNDINECRVRNGGCRSGQVCVNVPGHFRCMCQPGTRYDNYTATCVSTEPCDHLNGGCSQICRKGGICTCLPGYRVENKSCIDINECSQHNGGCQVNCINLPGSFACSCNPGSRLLADGRSCEREYDPCVANNGGCQHVCGSGALCSCYPGFRLAPNLKNCTFDVVTPLIKVMFVEKCPSCLLVTWPKPLRLDTTGRPFSLFYEVNCAEVKGRGKLFAITEGLELRVTGLNYSTEYRCFVTPMTSHGRGRASNIIVKVTGEPDMITITKNGEETVLDRILTPVIIFPIIGVLALLSLCLCLCLCIMCCCCRSAKWRSYDVSKAERKCSVIASPMDQCLLSPPITCMGPSPQTNKKMPLSEECWGEQREDNCGVFRK